METISTDHELANFMYNVAYLRRKHGLSRSRMAAILGISVKTLDHIEQGDFPKNLPAEVLFHILRWFGILPGRMLSDRLDAQG